MKSMARLGLIVLIVMAGFAFLTPANAQNGSFPRTVTDGAGNKVTINAQPTHIVSVLVASDEMLLSLVDSSRIAAVTSNSTDPTQSNVVDAVKAIPNKLAKADPEAIIALNGDLVVVGAFTDPGVVKQLVDAKLPVFMLKDFNSITDIENNITLLGNAVGEEQQAAKIIGDMEAQLAQIHNAIKNVKTPLTVLYYSPDGYSDGPGTPIDEVITRAGGINAVTAGGIKDAFPQLNDEFLVKQDPDVILLSGFNSYSPGFVDNFKANPNFQTLKALKTNHVVVANDADVASVSQYIVRGVSDVAALLYPDLYQSQVSATAGATMAATMSATAAQ